MLIFIDFSHVTHVLLMLGRCKGISKSLHFEFIFGQLLSLLANFNSLRPLQLVALIHDNKPCQNYCKHVIYG